MAKLRKVQHLRSSVQGKYPTLEQVEYGEITVNFYQGDEFLCIRNKGIKGDGSDDAIVSFRTWPYIQKVIEDNELVTAAALTTIKESCGFNVNGEYTPSATSKYISGVTTITDALDALDKNLSQTYTKNEIDSKGYLTEVPEIYPTYDWVWEQNFATVTQVEDKQDTLTAGDGINITDNIISCTLDTSLYSVVTTLPATGEANKIYLIKSEDSGDSNIYIEYGYIKDSWEKLGEYKAEIDLTPYLTKSEASNTYATKTTVEANELVTAAAITKLNESCGFNENAEFVPSTNATYISEATNVTEALNVLDENIPSIINLQTQPNSEWEPIASTATAAPLSPNNISFLQNNWEVDLILSFIDDAGNTVYSRALSKSRNTNLYRCDFIVSYYLVHLEFDAEDGTSDTAWYKIYN